MWRNYVTVGFRALAKNKTYAFINIFGLALGLAACLMILLYVRYELNYDKQLPGAEQAYQFQTYYQSDETGEEMNLQMAAYVTKAALQKDFPQIDKAVHALGTAPVVLKDGEASATEDFRFVDGNLFDILQVPFVQGDPRRALNDAGSVVLSETEARRYFGEPSFPVFEFEPFERLIRPWPTREAHDRFVAAVENLAATLAG